jgi:hypothetical protein
MDLSAVLRFHQVLQSGEYDSPLQFAVEGHAEMVAVLRQYLIAQSFYWASSCCSPFITVVKAANFSNLNYRSHCRQLSWPSVRRIFADR